MRKLNPINLTQNQRTLISALVTDIISNRAKGTDFCVPRFFLGPKTWNVMAGSVASTFDPSGKTYAVLQSICEQIKPDNHELREMLFTVVAEPNLRVPFINKNFLDDVCIRRHLVVQGGLGKLTTLESNQTVQYKIGDVIEVTPEERGHHFMSEAVSMSTHLVTMWAPIGSKPIWDMYRDFTQHQAVKYHPDN